MIEYPSIANSSKAPRKACVAFDKLDGSNFRAKWTAKKGFDLFGTRTQLIDESSPFWGRAVSIFKNINSEALDDYFKKSKEYRNEREIVVFGEFVGPNSFAGIHDENDEMEIVTFDVLVGHKNKAFIKPKEFIKEIGSLVKIPRVVYEGNLTDDFICRVRADEFNTFEGVICKGVETSGAYRGKVWQCKIKTQRYLDSLKNRFGDEWEKYAE